MSALKGKTALVTGAGQGIGAAIVEAYVREGARVHAWSRSAEKLTARFGDQANVFTQGVDLSNETAVTQAAAALPAIDILVNNAGWVPQDTLLEASADQMRRSFDQNVMTAFFASRAVAPGMIERGCGVILNMSSVLSSVSAAQNRFSYGMAKAALIGMTKAMALDYAGHGIRCNAICPGAVESEGLAERLDGQPDPQAARDGIKARTPLQMIGTLDNVAEMAVYLASDAGSFATGQTFVIDGGQAI